MVKNQSTKRTPTTLVAALAAAALAAALVPAAALAAPVDVNHNTAVKLYNESGQVTVVVPTAIPAAIGSDDSFVTAANAAKFKNEGVADVHVSKIGVVASSGVNLVAESAFSDASYNNVENTVWAAVAPGTGQKVDLAGYTTPKAPAVADQWNVAGSSELAINLSGAMKNLGATFAAADSPASAPVAFTITWTVAAGAAS